MTSEEKNIILRGLDALHYEVAHELMHSESDIARKMSYETTELDDFALENKVDRRINGRALLRSIKRTRESFLKMTEASE